jgi:chromosome segregation ATPase
MSQEDNMPQITIDGYCIDVPESVADSEKRGDHRAVSSHLAAQLCASAEVSMVAEYESAKAEIARLQEALRNLRDEICEAQEREKAATAKIEALKYELYEARCELEKHRIAIIGLALRLAGVE